MKRRTVVFLIAFLLVFTIDELLSAELFRHGFYYMDQTKFITLTWEVIHCLLLASYITLLYGRRIINWYENKIY